MNLDVKREEELVMYWLKDHGYYKVDVEPDHILIADGKIRKMIVAVRTPETINQNLDYFKHLAFEKNREPWVAIVEPADNDITWSAIREY